jgi:hypothetical protein
MTDIQHATMSSATPAQVIAAVTSEDGLRGFWTDQVEAKPEVGSVAVFRFGPKGEDEFKMRVDAIDTEREVTWTCVSGPPEWLSGTIHWIAGALPDGQTMARFEQRGLPADYDPAHVSFVWAMVLARLAEYAATGTPNPFFRRVAGM